MNDGDEGISREEWGVGKGREGGRLWTAYHGDTEKRARERRRGIHTRRGCGCGGWGWGRGTTARGLCHSTSENVHTHIYMHIYIYTVATHHPPPSLSLPLPYPSTLVATLAPRQLPFPLLVFVLPPCPPYPTLPSLTASPFVRCVLCCTSRLTALVSVSLFIHRATTGMDGSDGGRPPSSGAAASSSPCPPTVLLSRTADADVWTWPYMMKGRMAAFFLLAGSALT